MSSQYIQSEEELQQHLKDTVQALELSARAFDEGFEGEAKRLAASIRVLMHDTKNSRSLLGQLGHLNIPFYDTSIPRDPRTILTHNGITAMNITSSGAKYIAPLDSFSTEIAPRQVSFDYWWNGIIFVDRDMHETTRRDLILALANKDGGSHVDPMLNDNYANLSRRNSLAWRFSGSKGDVPLEGPELSAVRQITHEVLKSLNPSMPTVKPDVKGTLFMGATATVEDKQPAIPKVSRSALCPCGSGKKYKRCHGKI